MYNNEPGAAIIIRAEREEMPGVKISVSAQQTGTPEALIKVKVSTDGVPPGGEDGKILGHAQGKPMWVDMPKSGADAEEVKALVEAYMRENPYTINGEKPDENRNFVVNTLNDSELAELEARLT